MLNASEGKHRSAWDIADEALQIAEQNGFLLLDWQKMETGPIGRTCANGAASERVMVNVPPYGLSMAHYDNGWNCHSVLNKEAQPTHWLSLRNFYKALPEKKPEPTDILTAHQKAMSALASA